MITITVILEVDPAQLDAAQAAILANAEASRKEPGCLRFEVSRQLDKSNVFALAELYQDQAAVEAHCATPHFAIWREAAAAHQWIIQKQSMRGEVLAG
jgi:autoinducer 2-degrading protein